MILRGEDARHNGEPWCKMIADLSPGVLGREITAAPSRPVRIPNPARAALAPAPVLSGTGRTCQERLRRPFGQTLDRTMPVPWVRSYWEPEEGMGYNGGRVPARDALHLNAKSFAGAGPRQAV